jgi:hypothetical protein
VLLAHTARSVAVHEARHVADEGRLTAYLQLRLRCGDRCRDWDKIGLAELSAILASLAYSPARFIALYQACAMEVDNWPTRAAKLIVSELPGSCAEPTEDLAREAQALEQRLLGRSEPIVVPDDFPLALPVTVRERD